MSAEKIKKVLFIDTNIFKNCIFQKGSLTIDVLKKIEEHINSDKVVLILPEVIERELVNLVNKTIDNNYISVKMMTDKIKVEDHKIFLNKKTGDLAKNTILKEFEKNKASVLRELDSFLKNKKIIKIDISDENILSGLRRSLRGLRPHRQKILEKDKDMTDVKNDENDKGAFVSNADCVAFESLMSYLKGLKNKVNKCIICSDDSDYYINKEKDSLHIDIVNDLKRYCDDASGFKSPLDMLNKEFKEKITSKQKISYEENKIDNSYILDSSIYFNTPITGIPINQSFVKSGHGYGGVTVGNIYTLTPINGTSCGEGVLSWEPTPSGSLVLRASDFNTGSYPLSGSVNLVNSVNAQIATKKCHTCNRTSTFLVGNVFCPYCGSKL